jgi:zinc transport system permease protein
MPSESILAILSQVGLAAGLLLISSEPDFEHTAHELLFGDILAVSTIDVVALFVVASIVMLVLKFNWKKLLLISMSWEISQAEGLSVQKSNLIMYLLVALMVSVLIKVMGVLLIAALLVIPPTAVRWFSVNPEKMVVFTFVFGVLSIFSGFAVSAYWSMLTAPSIVLLAAIGLLISQLFKKLQNKH